MSWPSIGDYEVIRRLDVGGMAEVFLAKRERAGSFVKQVVVKQLLPRFAQDQTIVKMFLDEARLAARLNHPNICQVYDIGDTDGLYYISMEYIDGMSLRSLITSFVNRDAYPEPQVVAKIGADVAEALQFAHTFKDDSGAPMELVHRDVKPSNVILSRSGHIKLIDFGIARAKSRLTTTEVGTVKGTLRYMAPEQRVQQNIDHRIDTFALGLTLYESLACGLTPGLDPESPSDLPGREWPPLGELRPDLPPQLLEIVARATMHDPKERFQSARELQLALESYLSGLETLVTSDDLSRLVALHSDSDSPLVRSAAVSEVDTESPSDEPQVVEDSQVEEGDLSPTVMSPSQPSAPAKITPVTDRLLRSGLPPEERSVPDLSESRGGTDAAVQLAGVNRGRRLWGVTLVILLLIAGIFAVLRTPEPQNDGNELAATETLEAPDPPTELPPDGDEPLVPIPDEPSDSTIEPKIPEELGKGKPPRTKVPKRTLSPGEVKELYASANRDLLSGKFQSASKGFRKILRASPKHAGAHRGLGFSSAELGQRSLARKHLEMYLTLEPQAPDAAAVRGRLVRVGSQ